MAQDLVQFLAFKKHSNDLSNNKFQDLNSLPNNHSGNQNMKNQIGGECGMHRREERCRKIFGREITREEGKRPLRTPRYRWEINPLAYYFL